MTGATRGHLRTAPVAAGIILAAAACAANSPPAPTRPLNVRGVFECALRAAAANGWQAPPPGGLPIEQRQGPDQLSASLQRGDTELAFGVRPTDQGAITIEVVQVRPVFQRSSVEGQQLQQQIVSACMS